MRILVHIGIIIFVLLNFTISFSQTKEELRERIEQKENEISTANRLLEETRASKKSSLNELYLLQRRIELRNELIEHLNNQLNDLDQRIEQNQHTIKQLEEELKNPDLPEWLLNRRNDRETGEDQHLIESDLELKQEFDIRRLKEIDSYKGWRHKLGLPVRGQKTKSSFRSGSKVGVDTAAIKEEASPDGGDE